MGGGESDEEAEDREQAAEGRGLAVRLGGQELCPGEVNIQDLLGVYQRCCCVQVEGLLGLEVF